MVDALPDEVKMVLGGLVCLALPFVLAWMIWGLIRSFTGIAKGLAGGPTKACESLGLRVERTRPLSGEAAGQHRGHAVRVSWRVGHEHGYSHQHQHTRVGAAVQPPLGVGLEAREDLPAPSPPWPELDDRLGARADDPAAARAALGRAGPALARAMDGPGRLSIDDASVTIELQGVVTDRAALSAALDAATEVAAALTGR